MNVSNAFEGPVCFRSCCLNTRRVFFIICGILALLNAALDILYTSTTVYVMRWLFYGSVFFLIVRLALTILIGHCWYRYYITCLLYTSPSPRDLSTSRMPSSA